MKLKSRALFVELDDSNSLVVWACRTSCQQSFAETFPLLPEVPAWYSYIQLDSGIAVERLSLPPVVHFSPEATTNLYAATINCAKEEYFGDWIPADTILAKADGQWRSLLNCLTSEVRHAVLGGELDLPKQNISCSTAEGSNGLLAVQQTLPQMLRAKTTAESTCSGNNSADEECSPENSVGPVKEEVSRTAYGISPVAPVLWQPGLEAVIADGGHDVQRVLDSEGMALGVVHWHASWIAECNDLQLLLQRLAAKLPSVAFMHLDVEVSMANKLLAYEKTLERADSRRRGAKPVVRNAGRFPCISLHQPSNLVPLCIFKGQTALEELLKELQMTLPAAQAASTSAAASRPTAESVNQHEAAQEVSASPAEAAETVVHQSATPTAPEQSEATPVREESSTTVADDRTDIDKDEATGATPSSVKLLKKGALEFKQLLSKGKQQQHSVVVLWMSGRAGRPVSLQPLYPGTVFVEADVTASSSNRALAQALSLKAYPAVQVYSNMKIVKHVDAAGMLHLEELLDATLRAAAAPTAVKLEMQARSAEASETSTTAAGRQEPGDSGDVSEVTAPAPKNAETLKAESKHAPIWDPPQPAAKAGTKKRLPSGLAQFWPRMPCLRCGCPWWTGEDWDAQCARCTWSCESDGYDDDSKPLPKYKKQWQEFTAAIKDGRTPDWSA